MTSAVSSKDLWFAYAPVIVAGLIAMFIATGLQKRFPRPDLFGLYHVAARPISKYALLRLVADAYGKSIDIVKDDSSIIDRSLNAKRFESATGYVAPDWPGLVAEMHADWSRRSN